MVSGYSAYPQDDLMDPKMYIYADPAPILEAL
jgi:hypothetical protein